LVEKRFLALLSLKILPLTRGGRKAPIAFMPEEKGKKEGVDLSAVGIKKKEKGVDLNYILRLLGTANPAGPT